MVFVWTIVLATVLFGGAVLLGLGLALFINGVTEMANATSRKVGIATMLLASLVVYALMSVAYVPGDKVGLLVRTYGGSAMPPGRILARSGENGPQAEMLSYGWNHIPFMAFFYDVHYDNIVEVSDGKLIKLTARDGNPLLPDQAFADAFDPAQERQMIEDALYFLDNGGRKGPQTTVLKPGAYRLNTFLWEVEEDGATRVNKGEVAVVSSAVHSRVDFGNLKRDKPTVTTQENPRDETDLLSVSLVPVGAIGVWEEALTPGLYYIHPDAYQITPIDTRIQTWTYRGGYPRRFIDLEVDDNGEITQTVRQEPPETDVEASDGAIQVMIEGWLANLEVRVLGQVSPEDAPYVAVAIGDMQAVEDRIITPTLRSVARNVTGGEAVIEVATVGPDGQSVITKRAPKALDVYEFREVLEEAVLEDMRRACQGVRIQIAEVRFGEPGMPPELLVARRREQLASQLQKSFREEQLAQAERVKRENTKAEAEFQRELAQAEISKNAANTLKEKLQFEGEGERDKLIAIAEGQKAQVDVLGAEQVVRLRQYELFLDKTFALLEENPQILGQALANAHKFVPERVITVGQGGSGMEGFAAILGDFLGDRPNPPQNQ